jgi:hypothetical protein
MAKQLTDVEQAVLARRNADALYSNLDAAGRAAADEGLRWLALAGEVYTGPAKRGRPPGSKNRAAEVEQESIPEIGDHD